MHFADNILSNMDDGESTGAVFLDLSKAFDTVDHQPLIKKLRSLFVLIPRQLVGFRHICIEEVKLHLLAVLCHLLLQ